MASDSRAKGAFASRCIALLLRNYAGESTHLARVRGKTRGGVQRVAFAVLIATILSHRTKDARTEAATDALLSRYPAPDSLARAPVNAIRGLIRPAGFYNAKARYVKRCSMELVERYGGRVPKSMAELTALTGVGRKTAGCVIAYAFGLPAIPVDSHVHQIANRLGIVRTKTPLETECALMAVVPEAEWTLVNEAFVKHGQKTCLPVSPFCSRCPLASLCPRIGVARSR